MPRPRGIDDMIEYTSDLGKRAAAGASEVMSDIMDAVDVAAPAVQASINYYGESKTPSLRGSVKSSKSSETQSPGISALHTVPYGIGASSSLVVGNNWQTPITVRLGKRSSAVEESIKHFLKLVSGSGKVTTCFGGRLISEADKRAYCFNAFRHNLHGSSALNTSATYPTNAKILNPAGTLSLVFDGFPSDFANNKTLTNAPISNVVDGGFYWSPLNLADYEDMSWNLNRLKIARKTSLTTPGFADDAAIHGQDLHRVNSEIMQNNIEAAAAGTPSFSKGSRSYIDAPFKYNMVFKQGTVDYTLMNKGEGPCKVEVIVYRIKKAGNATLKAAFDSFDINDSLIAPVKQGYIDKIAERAGTDYLNGRPPVSTDCVSNPAHPFMPITRYTDQSRVPFVEVQRIPIIIPAGSRRPVKIIFGGDKYDPSSVVGRVTTHNNAYTPSRSIIDHHGYVVALSVHGVQSTRQFKAGDVKFATSVYTSDTLNVGDMYAPADLQWYMRYTEEIEAASYKDPGSSKIFVNGCLPEMNDSIIAYNDTYVPDGQGGTRPKNAAELLYTTPVTIIPQDRAVRVPVTQERFDFGTSGVGSSHVGVASNTPGAAAVSGQTEAPRT